MWPAFHSSFSRTSPSWTSPERIRSWTCSGVASWMRFLISAKKSRYVGIRAPSCSMLNRPVRRIFPVCSDFPVETLSFDLLQFLYHLALAILVGGSLVLGTAVAPALFTAARSRADAGTLFGSVLARFDGLAIFSVIVLAITSVLKAVSFEVT